MLNKNSLFIRSCRPYVEVLPDGFCKDYIPNQFIAQINKTAENTDIHIRRGIGVLKDFFLTRKPVPRHKILRDFNKVITSKHWTKNFRLRISLLCTFQKQSPEVFYKKGVLRCFTEFTGKHLCQSLLTEHVWKLLLTFFTFTKEVLNVKLHCLCREICIFWDIDLKLYSQLI